MSDNLAALAAQIESDLAKTAHPSQPWLKPVVGPDGRNALDVLIVGGGQSGLAIAFALTRSLVTNILVVDKADEGREGPWLTYARMPTLRSPKSFTGPDLDIPSLTYQSWHEAKFGEQSWRDLDLIPREYWADYLLWYRRVLDLPVRNGCEIIDIAPSADGLLAATVRGGAGDATLYARKIVLATGQEGMGDWGIPAPFRHLPATRCANSAASIDFDALRGRRVAVIGAGASAFDNAATALEAGAASVHLLCRRAEVQVIQPYRWLTFRGFLRHFSELDDVWRWRFMRGVLELREGFPQHTWDRCARHAAFHLRQGMPVEAARDTADGVMLETPRGEIAADFVICGTGIELDFTRRAELNRFAGNIARWSDRYTRAPAEIRRLYRQEIYKRDPFPHFNFREERVYALAELLDDYNPAHAAFRRDVLTPSGMREMRIVKVVEPGGVAAWLSIARSGPDFSAADGAVLSALAEHVRRALRNYASVERERFRTDVASRAIRRLNFGWISLDAQCRIVEADPNAQRLLQHSGELRRRRDRLVLADPALDRKLSETLRGFVTTSAKRPRAIRASRDPWIDLLLVPVETRAENAASTAVAVAYIQGDSRRSVDSHEELAELFGLLPSEARLALALSRGFSIAEAAAELGITVETARGYSKKIYAKLGARGQADLIRFILASILALA